MEIFIIIFLFPARKLCFEEGKYFAHSPITKNLSPSCIYFFSTLKIVFLYYIASMHCTSSHVTGFNSLQLPSFLCVSSLKSILWSHCDKWEINVFHPTVYCSNDHYISMSFKVNSVILL